MIIKTEKRQMITPRVTIELYKDMKISCIRSGITIDEFVSMAIKEKLNKDQ